jgi:hypothetical protein
MTPLPVSTKSTRRAPYRRLASLRRRLISARPPALIRLQAATARDEPDRTRGQGARQVSPSPHTDTMACLSKTARSPTSTLLSDFLHRLPSSHARGVAAPRRGAHPPDLRRTRPCVPALQAPRPPLTRSLSHEKRAPGVRLMRRGTEGDRALARPRAAHFLPSSPAGLGV